MQVNLLSNIDCFFPSQNLVNLLGIVKVKLLFVHMMHSFHWHYCHNRYNNPDLVIFFLNKVLKVKLLVLQAVDAFVEFSAKVFQFLCRTRQYLGTLNGTQYYNSI